MMTMQREAGQMAGKRRRGLVPLACAVGGLAAGARLFLVFLGRLLAGFAFGFGHFLVGRVRRFGGLLAVMVFVPLLAGCEVLRQPGQEVQEVSVDWRSVTPGELERLLESGELKADVPIYSTEGNKKISYPPMHAAVIKSQKPEVIDTLLKHGADIDSYIDLGTGDSRVTALDLLIYSGQIKMARYLLESGADLNAKERQDEPAFFYVFASSAAEIDYETRLAMIDLLLEHGVDINTVSYAEEKMQIKTPLISAIWDGINREEETIKLIHYLTSRGANVNARFVPVKKDGNSLPAMHMAAMGRSAVLVNELIKLGGDVNILAGNDCWTPLLYFAFTGQSIEVFDALILAEANIDHVCPNGENMLDMIALRKEFFSYKRDFSDYSHIDQDKFFDKESWIAFGDVILARVKSLCERREYNICNELEEMT